MTDKYIKSCEAVKILNIHPRTLYYWEKQGWIETIRSKGGIRLYNVDKYMREINITRSEKITNSEVELETLDELENKLNISYVRVSTAGQKDDMERQEIELKTKYPNNIIIKDIGSGINLNRRGLRKIIELAIAGKINKVVVAYKDRLTRFGYELIEDIIKKYSGGTIEILNEKEDMTPEEELTRDVLQIMNVFVAKMNGLRKYKGAKVEEHVTEMGTI